ncbi:hypothetical protein KC329_g46 [Hortaea werneckii]|nr:hypothetical protein KC329_g46 [Hortaea werneckii]
MEVSARRTRCRARESWDLSAARRCRCERAYIVAAEESAADFTIGEQDDARGEAKLAYESHCDRTAGRFPQLKCPELKLYAHGGNDERTNHLALSLTGLHWTWLQRLDWEGEIYSRRGKLQSLALKQADSKLARAMTRDFC